MAYDDKENNRFYKNVNPFIIPSPEEEQAKLDSILKRIEERSRQGQPKSIKQKKPKTKETRAEILEPLDRVFFEPELMNELIVKTSIPQLLDRKEPLHHGVILFGPPGTGKSEFQNAVLEVYENAGAYSKAISSSQIDSCWVSQLAKNLEEELSQAMGEGEYRKLPSFLSFDEGSIFAQKADDGAKSVSKHYQEAIDLLKRYIGNDAGKWLVLAISTNLHPEQIEEAVKREGRLSSINLHPPTIDELALMWKYFSSKKALLPLNDSQARELAEITKEGTGALVENFCSAYHDIRKNALLKQRGYLSILDALKSEYTPTDEEIMSSMNYNIFKNDLMEYLKTRKVREQTQERRKIGFEK